VRPPEMLINHRLFLSFLDLIVDQLISSIMVKQRETTLTCREPPHALTVARSLIFNTRSSRGYNRRPHQRCESCWKLNRGNSSKNGKVNAWVSASYLPLTLLTPYRGNTSRRIAWCLQMHLILIRSLTSDSIPCL